MFSCLDVGVDEDGHLHGAVDHYRDTPLLVHDDLPLLWVGAAGQAVYIRFSLLRRAALRGRMPPPLLCVLGAAGRARGEEAYSLLSRQENTTGLGPSLVCVCVCVCTTGFGPSLVCVCVYDGLLPFGFKARMSRAPRGDLGVCPWPLISR